MAIRVVFYSSRAIIPSANPLLAPFVCLKRPGLLERRADVRFALKCQAFIELIKKGEMTAAVALAQVKNGKALLVCRCCVVLVTHRRLCRIRCERLEVYE